MHLKIQIKYDCNFYSTAFLQVESVLNDFGNLESLGPEYNDDDLNLIEPSLVQLSSTVSKYS